MAAQFSAQADDLIKSSILENNVSYLRVGEVETNLPAEIQSAQSSAATNQIAGTVLDLRFAGGDDADAATAAGKILAQTNLPLAILVNDETSGAAVELARDLRAAKAGLIFGDSTNLSPDIAISVNAADEKSFMENPFGTISNNDLAETNNFLPSVDHTTEADLVHEKIKDDAESDLALPPPPAAPPKPFIRDPVLAQGVDFIEGLAVLHLSHS